MARTACFVGKVSC